MKYTQGLVAWCRSHDWGRGAYYRDGRVCGLEDHYTLHGASYTNIISLPADRKHIREWAGY